MEVPFVGLQRQFHALHDDLLAAFERVGTSGMYIMGEELERFEAEAARYCGARDAVGAIAAERGIAVLEDAAQAIGARYRGRRVGSLGTAAGFSLHPLKNLGVYGDGGLITTDDSQLFARLSKLRNHGLRNRDECE